MLQYIRLLCPLPSILYICQRWLLTSGIRDYSVPLKRRSSRYAEGTKCVEMRNGTELCNKEFIDSGFVQYWFVLQMNTVWGNYAVDRKICRGCQTRCTLTETMDYWILNEVWGNRRGLDGEWNQFLAMLHLWLLYCGYFHCSGIISWFVSKY